MAGASFQALLGLGAPGLTLTYKGHGSVFSDVNTGPTLNYSTVNGGSAPAAGDLVCWKFHGTEYYDNSPLDDGRRRDLTGAGWVQSNNPAIPGAGAPSFTQDVSMILAKVVVAGDISSPARAFGDGTLQAGITGASGYWVAFTVAGTINSLTIPVHDRQYGNTAAPANVAVDSSALNPPAIAITLVSAIGDDDSIQLSGITLDNEVTKLNYGQYYSGNVDHRAGHKRDVGGASYTLSKGDDGSLNALHGGYVAVS